MASDDQDGKARSAIEETLSADVDEIIETSNLAPKSGPVLQVGASVLVLILGVVLGVVFATFGTELIVDNVFIFFASLLSLVVLLAIIFLLLLVFRRPLLSMFFRRGEVELERFAAPLADMVRHTADKRVEDASKAARDFGEMMLARYAWVSTRRWLIASLTGIIASIAALAGSALLFQQNTLLKRQNAFIEEQNRLVGSQQTLLEDQNELIGEQTGRLDTQNDLVAAQTVSVRKQGELANEQKKLAEISIQLAEAARSATLAPVIADIARELGEVKAKVEQEEGRFELLPTDVSLALHARIASVTEMARPYRFLDLEPEPDFSYGARRSSQQVFRDMVEGTAPTDTLLVERPQSLERGQLLRLFATLSYRDLRLLNGLQANFDDAFIQVNSISDFNLSYGRFARATFSGMILENVRLQGASLSQARFTGATLKKVDFSPTPFPASGGLAQTNLNAVDFEGALLSDVNMETTVARLNRYNGAVLSNVSFKDAGISGSEFIEAVLLDVDFTNAEIPLVAFDNAIVTDPTFLTKIERVARPGTFAASAWRLEPIEPGGLLKIPALSNALELGFVDRAAVDGKDGFRVIRVSQQ